MSWHLAIKMVGAFCVSKFRAHVFDLLHIAIYYNRNIKYRARAYLIIIYYYMKSPVYFVGFCYNILT